MEKHPKEFGALKLELEHNFCQTRTDFFSIKSAPKEVQQLFEKVYDFENGKGDENEGSHLFSDMKFEPGSITAEHLNIRCDDDIYSTIRFSSIEFFSYRVEDMKGIKGKVNCRDYILSIDPTSLTEDNVILHEMIHMHEIALELAPKIYYDTFILCLYKELSRKISDLDKRIYNFSPFAKMLSDTGQTHSIAFLLKSFDLDLRMGYKLGTVFGVAF